MQFQFATIEWLWNTNALRVNLPGGHEEQQGGSYKEVVETLCRLGAEGWSVVSCVAAGNWLFWTLQRGTSRMS